MTLCPIAIAVGCKKCPAFTVCPLKGVVGDYKAPEGADPKPQADGANRDKLTYTSANHRTGRFRRGGWATCFMSA